MLIESSNFFNFTALLKVQFWHRPHTRTWKSHFCPVSHVFSFFESLLHYVKFGTINACIHFSISRRSHLKSLFHQFLVRRPTVDVKMSEVLKDRGLKPPAIVKALPQLRTPLHTCTSISRPSFSSWSQNVFRFGGWWSWSLVVVPKSEAPDESESTASLKAESSDHVELRLFLVTNLISSKLNRIKL